MGLISDAFISMTAMMPDELLWLQNRLMVLSVISPHSPLSSIPLRVSPLRKRKVAGDFCNLAVTLADKPGSCAFVLFVFLLIVSQSSLKPVNSYSFPVDQFTAPDHCVGVCC